MVWVLWQQNHCCGKDLLNRHFTLKGSGGECFPEFKGLVSQTSAQNVISVMRISIWSCSELQGAHLSVQGGVGWLLFADV